MRRQLSLVLSLNLFLFVALPLSLPAAMAETNANPAASPKAGAGAKAKAPANSKAPASASAAPGAAAKGLHRLDFLLEKASCATCILKVRLALRKSIGVAACEIALRKPYGAVVIFDPAKINFEKMKEVATAADPNHHVELVDPVEKPVPSVPTLLVPLYSSLKKGP